MDTKSSLSYTSYRLHLHAREYLQVLYKFMVRRAYKNPFSHLYYLHVRSDIGFIFHEMAYK